MTLEKPLDTGLSDHLTRPIVRPGSGAQLVRTDFSDRAQQMGSEFTFHVVTTRAHIRQNAREFEPVGFDAPPVIEGQVGDEPHGTEAPPPARRADTLPERRRLRVEQHPESSRGAIGRVQIARQHRDAEGRPRRRQHPTLAVEDVAPRRLEPNQSHGVPLGNAREFLALEDLELEEAQDKDPEDQQDSTDEHGQPPLDRNFGTGPQARTAPVLTLHNESSRESRRSNRPLSSFSRRRTMAATSAVSGGASNAFATA